MRILISGAGIAGLTLAYWLKKYGFDVTVVEQSRRLREGGYLIDFFGLGFAVAEKMGIADILRERDTHIRKLSFVNEQDQQTGGFEIGVIRKLLKDRACSILRSDLAATIYGLVKMDVPIIFGQSIRRLDRAPDKISVLFTDHDWDTYDLIIGADGLRSNLRKLVFGEDETFERYCGYYTASYSLFDYSGDKTYRSYSMPGKQVGVYALGENKSAAFFVFRSPHRLNYNHHDVKAQKKILQFYFGNEGWECPQILERMDSAPDFYFDSVSQIQMKTWSQKRVALIGDAAYCPSLLSGQGASLAVAGAYILAGELKSAKGDHRIAFENYEKVLRPLVEIKQKMGRSFADSFAPKSKFGIWVRDKFTNVMNISFFAKMFINGILKGDFPLKEY